VPQRTTFFASSKQAPFLSPGVKRTAVNYQQNQIKSNKTLLQDDTIIEQHAHKIERRSTYDKIGKYRHEKCEKIANKAKKNHCHNLFRCHND